MAVLLIPLLMQVCVLATPTAAAGELSPVGQGGQKSFSLPDLAGEPVALARYRGKALLINFWASWCRPCREEMPAIRRLRAALRDQPFEVIGINVGETPSRARTAAQRLGLDFPILLDRDSRVFEDWGAQILPTSYVLDASGRVSYRALGPLEWDGPAVIDRLRALAHEASAAHR